METLSVVIITKNEAANILACIASAKKLTDDVVVVDCGSTDETVVLAQSAAANVLEIEWQCYGHSRNTGAKAAKYNWILALDADERISDSLLERLTTINLSDPEVVYKIKRENYFGETHLNFGTLGFEQVPRLYCRDNNSWDLYPVHERLLPATKIQRIRETILHYGISDLQQHIAKKEYYAQLSAYKYLQQGKKATFTKRFLAPLFNGLKSYLFQLGLADGKKGWEIAMTISYYTWLKYHYLHQLNKSKELPAFSNLPTETEGAMASVFAKR